MNKFPRYIGALALSLTLLAPMTLQAQSHKAQKSRSEELTKVRSPKSEETIKAKRERIRSEKRAFLVKELNLSASEADALMALLNELDDKRFALWMQLEPIGKRLRQGDKTLTAEELSAFYEKSLDFHVQEAELERTYYLRARPILNGERLVKLPWVCKEFARRFFDKHKPKKRP